MSDLMPWEKDGEEFNAEVAKNLILNLRNDKSQLQAKLNEANDSLESRNKELAKATETIEEQKATLSLANEDITSKESKLAEIETLRTKEHLLIDKGLPLNLVKFVPDGDEETMTSAVADLLELRGTPTSVGVDPAQVAEPADNADAKAAAYFDALMNK
ncbi:hypothetical protein [uncultured Rothia sp.]|uniref:hypothetical protein n=1 Tax=uncultured Rothia sp. TaxID=316088 RepID=UPI003216C190